MAYQRPGSSFSRRLAGRVSEVGTPQPRQEIDPARKSKAILADVGQGLLAVAPLAVGAIPGIGPAAAFALKSLASMGGGLASKAREEAATKKSGTFAATQASAQAGNESTRSRAREDQYG